MKRSLLILNVVIWSILFYTTSYGQTKFANTMSYDSIQGSPKANLTAVQWIAGHWRGEAFGGVTEEIWTPPLGGSMMCVFKLIVDDEIQFYEIVTIRELNETLLLQLKHFNEALQGWEEKKETVDFKLVKITDSRVFFDDFTIERISDDEINIYVVIDDAKQGGETKFSYKRVKK